MSASSTATTTAHRWRFFRAGGLDLVRLETADDFRNLGNLDQKLWTALACPVKGLEFDEKTLASIDKDKDGRVRAPELIEAVNWVCTVLEDPATLTTSSDTLSLANIKDAGIQASAREILASLGKENGAAISLADVADTARIFAQTRFNGDGVVTTRSAGTDAATAQVIGEAIATVGSLPDRSGEPGIDAAKVGAFYDALAAFDAWTKAGEAAAATIFPLGEQTAAAFAAFAAVRAKIEDYFARCRLAAFDARATAALNRQETEYLLVAAKDLSITIEEIVGFPLSRIEVNRPLPLRDGVNPAWAGALSTLASAVVDPLAGKDKSSLTETEWTAIKAKLAPYQAWQSAKAGGAVESLGIKRVRELLAGQSRAALTALIAQDNQLAPHFATISEVERLVRYHRDLYRLLLNFVSFADLYDPRRPAIFQAGRLYLDSRSCDLCIRVDAPNPLAAMSKSYIAYVNCTRPGCPPMTVAACFTQGDSDYLFAGRHGLFYDRQGRDWDAVITTIVDNPISVRQAFWSPYKKFLRMIEEQVAKRAAAAEAASTGRLATAAEKTANVDKVAPIDPAKKIDVGAVAALGVAFGALTTAFGYFLGFFKGMPPWEVPLVFLAVMLLISLPSMIIAGLKLRQRTIGPILDGNGWAINGRVRVNIPFGTTLTAMARISPMQRIPGDPYAEKKTPWRLYLFLLLVLVGAACWVRWDHNRNGHYLWEKPTPKVEAPAAPAAADAPAPTPAPPPAAAGPAS